MEKLIDRIHEKRSNLLGDVDWRVREGTMNEKEAERKRREIVENTQKMEKKVKMNFYTIVIFALLSIVTGISVFWLGSKVCWVVMLSLSGLIVALLYGYKIERSIEE